MRIVNSNNDFLPDIIATSCSNSIKLKNVDFRVPCGKCLNCQKKRRSDWSLRLYHEYLYSDSAFFITLTYDEINVPTTKEGYKTLHKKHIQDYIKRLRNDHIKYVQKHFKVSKKDVYKVSKKVRYYAVGEYGTKTRRPHYHMLLFNYDIANLAPLTNQWKNTDTNQQFGHVDIGTVSGASINYVTKYMFKDHYSKDKRVKPFSLMSKKPIIGQAYLDQYKNYHETSNDLTTADGKGTVRRLPKAYLYRIFQLKDENNNLILDYHGKPQKDKFKLQYLSQESFEKHYDKKVELYNQKLEQHYSGNVLDYTKSKDEDLIRYKNTININETL